MEELFATDERVGVRIPMGLHKFFLINLFLFTIIKFNP